MKTSERFLKAAEYLENSPGSFGCCFAMHKAGVSESARNKFHSLYNNNDNKEARYQIFFMQLLDERSRSKKLKKRRIDAMLFMSAIYALDGK